MAQKLLRMATDDDVADNVKLAAIKDALDRAGLKPPTQVEVEVGAKPYERIAENAVVAGGSRAASRMRRGVAEADQPALASGAGHNYTEVVDAEIVPDPQEADAHRPSGPVGQSSTADEPTGRPAWAEPANPHPRPGRELMTMEQAMAEANRANRRW